MRAPLPDLGAVRGGEQHGVAGLDGEGFVEGGLVDEGADGAEFFQVIVRTDRSYLGTSDNPLPITPGMVATVDIQTGEKTVLSYLAKPLLRAQSEALRER